MTQQTMTEIDAFKHTFENEYRTTRKLLHAYPAAKAEMKPAEKMKSAKELAWMLTLNQMVVVPTLEVEKLDGSGLPKPVEKWEEILATFDKAHKDTVARLGRITDAEWNGSLQMPTGPKQMGSMRRGEALWLFLHDTIHHRGQFSTYLRLAGAKVPSIYGPSADEPWV